jgi:hypothetical protein
MEINLDELMTLQRALVKVKMFLSNERKIDQGKTLKSKVISNSMTESKTVYA